MKDLTYIRVITKVIIMAAMLGGFYFLFASSIAVSLIATVVAWHLLGIEELNQPNNK